MNVDNFKALFKEQIDLGIMNTVYSFGSPAANEEIFEYRPDDYRLTYYVRTYPKNQLQLEVKGFWASELSTMHEKFKNGWPPEKGIIPQLDPR